MVSLNKQTKPPLVNEHDIHVFGPIINELHHKKTRFLPV